MEEPKEIGPEEEARLAISHEIKQMAEVHGLLDEDRAQAEGLRTQIITITQGPQTEEQAHQFQQLFSAYHELYQKIDTEKPEGRTSKFKFAITLEMAALLLDAGKIEDALERELYDARTMVDQEEPRDQKLFDKIDALYKQLKQLITR